MFSLNQGFPLSLYPPPTFFFFTKKIIFLIQRRLCPLSMLRLTSSLGWMQLLGSYRTLIRGQGDHQGLKEVFLHHSLWGIHSLLPQNTCSGKKKCYLKHCNSLHNHWPQWTWPLTGSQVGEIHTSRKTTSQPQQPLLLTLGKMGQKEKLLGIKKEVGGKIKMRAIIVIMVFPSHPAVGFLAVEGKPGHIWTWRNTVYHEKE